jgi:hypothetical protein
VTDLILWAADGADLACDVTVDLADVAIELRRRGHRRSLELLDNLAEHHRTALGELPAGRLGRLGAEAFTELLDLLGGSEELWDLFEGLVSDADGTTRVGALIESCKLISAQHP